MKKPKPRDRVIKELATQFENELNRALPISLQPNGSIVYKTCFIKSEQGDWGIYDLHSRDKIAVFHLKTCALMAAKYFIQSDMQRFSEVKHLDNKYWACHSDAAVYRHNIKQAKDLDRYVILLNKLEWCEAQEKRYQEEISTMFKWRFV
jgi:hypothetical protein